MSPAWQVDRKWQAAEPGECRPVISAPVVQAMTALALAWQWPRFAGILLIGFLCMLHPAEYVHLTRGDLILPSDAMSSEAVGYIHVRNPKTARFARRQHCRLEDSSVLAFVEAVFGTLPFDSPLYPRSTNTLRCQWNAILARKQSDKGCTPGVLRGSGATYLYLNTEDIGKVAWRGRWARQKRSNFIYKRLLLKSFCRDFRKKPVTELRSCGPCLHARSFLSLLSLQSKLVGSRSRIVD